MTPANQHVEHAAQPGPVWAHMLSNPSARLNSSSFMPMCQFIAALSQLIISCCLTPRSAISNFNTIIRYFRICMQSLAPFACVYMLHSKLLTCHCAQQCNKILPTTTRHCDVSCSWQSKSRRWCIQAEAAKGLSWYLSSYNAIASRRAVHTRYLCARHTSVNVRSACRIQLENVAHPDHALLPKAIESPTQSSLLVTPRRFCHITENFNGIMDCRQCSLHTSDPELSTVEAWQGFLHEVWLHAHNTRISIGSVWIHTIVSCLWPVSFHTPLHSNHQAVEWKLSWGRNSLGFCGTVRYF